jgi:PKD repeat protein
MSMLATPFRHKFRLLPISRRLVCAFVVCGVALAATESASQAQKVLNPTASLGGTVTSLSFDFAKGGGHERQGSLSGLSAPLVSGARIAADGSITLPQANITYPPYPIPDQSGTMSTGCCGTAEYSLTNASVQVVPTSDVTGSLNPFTGAATTEWHAYLKVVYHLQVTYGSLSESYEPKNCTIGTSASPIDIQFTTGTTEPPAGTPNMPINGVPYSESDGSLGLVNNTIALPNSSGDCNPTFYGFFTFSFDELLGLPSPSGYNTLTVNAVLNPVIRRGVIAALNPSARTGTAPLTVSFDASGTLAPAGVASYQFDFNGDGVADQAGVTPTGSFTFTQPGVYTARLTTTDTGGDSDTSSATITVTAPPAALPASPAGPLVSSLTASAPTVTSIGKPKVSGKGNSITVDDGQTVQCPPGPTACQANVTVTTNAGPGKRGASAGSSRHAAGVTIARATLAIPPGGTAPVRFRLTRKAAALLRRRHHLRVTVTVVVRAGSNTPRTAAVTFTLTEPR